MKKLISIVVPVLNEAENIPLIHSALKGVFDRDLPYCHEIIFVNDGSTDRTSEIIEPLASKDESVKYIELSRNFGQDIANTAGIQAAKGDAILMMDADLQHPPGLIPQFIARWEKGADIVCGIRKKNGGVGVGRKIGSKLFYTLMNFLTDEDLIPGQTDFCLIDRNVAAAFNTLPEHRRLTRSLINWLGFNKAYIEFEAPSRVNGESKYSPKKLLNQALHSFISNSLLPLRLAGYLGFAMTFFSGSLGLIVFVQRYIFNDIWNWGVSGSAQLAIINVFLVGVVLMALGIIALYIANIHVEVAGRPLYIVRRKVNFK